jgi:SAM-dependent methyltransferase
MSYPPLTLSAWLRYDVVRRLLSHLDRADSVLEIGVGQGALGTRLASEFRYVGVEQDATSWEKAKARIERYGGTVLHGDVSVLPPSAKFDVVCVFEVLEHIEDDQAALRDWRTRLNPGGSIMVSVPAFPERFGAWDIKAGHYRRYEPQELAQLLVESGYSRPEVRVYGFPLGYVLEWGRHRVAKQADASSSLAERTAASGRALQPPDGIAWATRLASAPFRLLQRSFHRSRRGIGLVALAQRAD